MSATIKIIAQNSKVTWYGCIEKLGWVNCARPRMRVVVKNVADAETACQPSTVSHPRMISADRIQQASNSLTLDIAPKYLL